MLFIFYWGRQPLKRYFVRSLHESISTIVVTNPRTDTLYYNQAVSHRKHHLSMINWWTESGGLFRHPTLPLPTVVYNDFKGKIFQIPVVHKPPWYFVEYGNDSFEVYGGRDDKLLEVLANKLNFRYEYFDPVEQSQVSVLSNNSFQSAVGLVWKREADFFLGDVTLTLDRSTLVEFSFLTLADSGAFITHAPSRLNEALALIRPFHWKVWPPLILTVVFAGPVLYILIALPDFWRHKRSIKSHSKLFTDCVWFTTALFLKQMGKEPSRSDKSRLFIIIISIAATYVIGDMYSANLTSLLARPGTEKPINNLVQLEVAMTDHEYKLYVEEHSSFYDLLQNGTGIYGRLWNLMKKQDSHLVDSVENGVKMVKNSENIVVIAGRETLFFDIQRFGPANFHLSEKLNTAYSAIALQIGCPYIENMNRVLMAVFEAGILTKMTENEYEMLGKKQVQEEDETISRDPGKSAGSNPEPSKEKVAKANDNNGRLRPINIKMLQGAFYVVIIGHFLAVFIFLTEIKIHQHFKNKPDLHISFICVKKFKVNLHIARKRIFAFLKRKYDQVKEHILLALLDYVD
ncbi:Ionotropic receptor 40a [Carabus blaptoides fortunei]